MIRAYVAGAYTALSTEARDINVSKADYVGRELLALGYAPIIPHKNTLNWETDGRFSFEDFLNADFALLETCQLLVICGEYRHSKGTLAELNFARENGIPVYYRIDDVPMAKDFKTDIPTRVIKDCLKRRQIGVAEYGLPVTEESAFDGLQYLYEELLDATVYVQKALAQIKQNT